jgi:hypothetical protein
MPMKSIMLIFSFSVTALAQPSLITFSPGECCSTAYQDGKAYYVIRDANVSVMVSAPANYSARLHSVFVSVLQLGDTPVDVNPATFSATAEDADHTVLPYLNEDERAEKERKHKARVSGILLAISAGASGAAAASPQTATVNNSDGTSSTITYTDPNAQARANAQAAEQGDAVRQSIRAAHDSKVKDLLRRNTLQRGGSASGVVYFEGPKGMKNTKKGFTPVAHLDIPVNGTIYRFQ